MKQLITKTDAAELVEAAQSFAGQIGAGQETLLFLNGRIINYTEGVSSFRPPADDVTIFV